MTAEQGRGLERITRVLVLVSTLSLIGLVVALGGWYRSTGTTVDELSSEERQFLLQEVLAESPGIYRWAFFEPRLGYTMRPNAELTSYGSTYTTNEAGYRTGPLAKDPGVFRVVFLGDSWTYGVGIQRRQTFAEEVARLANEHAAVDRRVEAWVLAMPGWNSLNEIAALWYLYESLEPDAVMLTISGNDNHSTTAILPTGSLFQGGTRPDQFGDPHISVYRGRRIDSYRYQDRWRLVLDEIRDTEGRLQEHGVPFFVFFLARWREVLVPHSMIARGEIEAPYAVAPREVTVGEWRGAGWGHGSVEANRLYARMAYRLLAGDLGWAPLPPGDPLADIEVYRRPPTEQDWLELYRLNSIETTAEFIPDSFRPGSRGARLQVVGPLNYRTGGMGASASILVANRQGSTSLEVTVSRLSFAPSIYPLELTVSIPSPSGGTRTVTTVPSDGPATHRFSVAIPADLEEYTALDIVFVASRTAASADLGLSRSLRIQSIEHSR